jgi:WhiB family redox-sensing transcriptional regulator
VGWAEEVNCADVDPELFFDEHRQAEACRVCRGCPARAACLDEALHFGLNYGVFGGLTPRERRRLRRARWAG